MGAPPALYTVDKRNAVRLDEQRISLVPYLQTELAATQVWYPSRSLASVGPKRFLICTDGFGERYQVARLQEGTESRQVPSI